MIQPALIEAGFPHMAQLVYMSKPGPWGPRPSIRWSDLGRRPTFAEAEACFRALKLWNDRYTPDAPFGCEHGHDTPELEVICYWFVVVKACDR